MTEPVPEPRQPGAQDAPDSHDAIPPAFHFVNQLAADLSAGQLELPSYPKAALQLQRLLSDDNADSARIIRILGAEPVLAARILRMANSAALNPSGKAIPALRDAVSRLGFDALRTAAVGFAIAQLRKAGNYKGIEPQLDALWDECNAIAATSYVIARATRRFGADTALLCGLVSGIGKLYILTRAKEHPALLRDVQTYAHIVTDWHATIARAVLETWSMSDEIVQAVQNAGSVASDVRSAPSLADVLSVAQTLVGLGGSRELLGAISTTDRALQRLGLDAARCEGLLDESGIELDSLREALGE
jgi:HD-like signal output (HDOD) protein